MQFLLERPDHHEKFKICPGNYEAKRSVMDAIQLKTLFQEANIVLKLNSFKLKKIKIRNRRIVNYIIIINYLYLIGLLLGN